jgi:hypothetical protein
MTISDTYFQAFYDELTEGQKQHMTNKIYKETGMYPQKLHKAPAAYPSGSKFINKGSGRTYVLSCVRLNDENYWAAINPDTGLAYTAMYKADRITEDNINNVLSNRNNFIGEL